jgi:hypothetical protein
MLLDVWKVELSRIQGFTELTRTGPRGVVTFELQESIHVVFIQVQRGSGELHLTIICVGNRYLAWKKQLGSQCCKPLTIFIGPVLSYYSRPAPIIAQAIVLVTLPLTFSPPSHSTVTVIPRSSPFSFAYCSVPSSTVPFVNTCFRATSRSSNSTA